MRFVLLSGGSGKRLWPMSNDSRSKQFLKFLDDGKGNKLSMLQRVWSQLSALGFDKDVYICASKAQREMIESQVGLVSFIEEPARRDTFPAIALAVTYLSDIEGYGDDEVVAVLPIDPMVDSSYFLQIHRLKDVLCSSEADLALMGVRPTEPSSKFGYIRVLAESTDEFKYADSFIEKPAREVAIQLIADGALWNCGVFCFRIGYIKQILASQGNPTSYYDLVPAFEKLSRRSFDYEVVEKTKRIAVLPFEGSWKDLGTWESLSTEISSEFVGVGQAIRCGNTHVINELGIPLVTVGLQNAIVVATPDGILVSDKTQSSSIKSIAETYDKRPMFEERIWGSYRVLDYHKSPDGTEILTKCIELLPGKNISYQKHLMRSEVWTVIEGNGEIVLDTNIRSIQAGDVVRVHAGQWHAIRAEEKLTFIEVQRGNELIEEDIIRRFMNWTDILMHCQVLT